MNDWRGRELSNETAYLWLERVYGSKDGTEGTQADTEEDGPECPCRKVGVVLRAQNLRDDKRVV